uniref:CASC1 C-terminal domain-containing protein n=1 Tax=Glossina brevipalpis TaxID=37001 RepID=A0A1A9W5X3_9MUSC
MKKQIKRSMHKVASSQTKASSSYFTQKTYKLMTSNEMKVRHERYTSLLLELKFITGLMKEARQKQTEVNELQKILDQWEKYINCERIPDHYPTNVIHTFYVKDRFHESECVVESIVCNWSAFDCNMLSQNISKREMECNTKKDLLTPHYTQSIDDKLKVLYNINKYLNDDNETIKATTNQLQNIMDMKDETEKRICDVFNHFTYRIISAENTYMQSLDAISSEFSYSCSNFEIHLWCLKNVPIRFTHLDEPRLIANLHKLNLVLHLPYSVLRPELTIQGIHMNFDHISERARTFKQEVFLPLESLNAGIQDLMECLVNEYKMLMEIQYRVGNEIKENYNKYTEELLKYSESVKLTKKGLNPKKDRKPFRFKEPQFCSDNEYPDVINDFLEEEHNQYLGFINIMYNPLTLDLKSHEINLKKFHILGGIYKLTCVKKPKQCDFYHSFNMIWHSEGENLIVEEDFQIQEPRTILSEALTRSVSRSRLTRISAMNLQKSRMSTNLLNERFFESDENESSNPWFVLTFYLPDYLCQWDEPIACHYESVEEVAAIKKDEDTREGMVSSLLKVDNDDDDDDDDDGWKDTSPEEKQLMQLQSLLLTRKTPFRSMYDTALSTFRVFNQPSASILYDRETYGTINDFKLNSLSVEQVHKLERHCIPLLLSSYKFPREFEEDKRRVIKRVTRMTLGTTTRSLYNPQEEKTTKSRIFSFEDSKNPERLFAKYDEMKPVLIAEPLQPSAVIDADREPNTFYKLIKILMLVKKLIQRNVNNIMLTTLHQAESEIERIQEQLKTKLRKKKLKSKKIEILPVAPLTITKKSLAKLPSKSLQVVRSTQNIVDVTNNLSSESSDSKDDLATTTTTTSSKDAKEDTKVITYKHWTTNYIKSSKFIQAERKFVIETDRLGYIGFAFKRYEHFPFKYWDLQPNEVDEQGVRGDVTEVIASKKFINKPIKYLVIQKPIKDYTELKKRFKEKNLNIFPDNDACFYVENGYFSEKHLAMELHTYKCMAIHCSQMKFSHCQWNRLAKRRDIILQFVQYKDNPDNTVVVHVTPEETTFVEVREMCTEDVNEVNLSYTPTWRNIDISYDLNQAVCSMYTEALDLRCKNKLNESMGYGDNRHVAVGASIISLRSWPKSLDRNGALLPFNMFWNM